MDQSLQQQSRVTHEQLMERMSTIKALQQTDVDSYEIMKDQLTGEHYLVYMYIHLNIAEGGHRETYYQLMPIPNDDVIAYIMEEAPYEYPEHWLHPYLRNSEKDTYVWFDPNPANQSAAYEKIGHQVQEQLTTFKKRGNMSEADVRKLLEDLDKL